MGLLDEMRLFVMRTLAVVRIVIKNDWKLLAMVS